jgi:hypothetical protein
MLAMSGTKSEARMERADVTQRGPDELGCRASVRINAAKIKYRRFTGEMRRQLQCNALHGREKSRRRKNRGEQEKKQGAEQWKQAKIQESTNVRL